MKWLTEEYACPLTGAADLRTGESSWFLSKSLFL
jgi:hypothetical protein